jgi:hypothetical protein
LNNRKSNDADFSNVVYATEYISKITKYIISALEEANTSISMILVQIKDFSNDKSTLIRQHKSKFENIKFIFHITRLLQDYARIVGPNVDEGILIRIFLE